MLIVPWYTKVSRDIVRMESYTPSLLLTS